MFVQLNDGSLVSVDEIKALLRVREEVVAADYGHIRTVWRLFCATIVHDVSAEDVGKIREAIDKVRGII